MGGLPYPELSDWHPKGNVTNSAARFDEGWLAELVTVFSLAGEVGGQSIPLCHSNSIIGMPLLRIKKMANIFY